jgi:hypothetical protein
MSNGVDLADLQVEIQDDGSTTLPTSPPNHTCWMRHYVLITSSDRVHGTLGRFGGSAAERNKVSSHRPAPAQTSQSCAAVQWLAGMRPVS